MIRRATWRAIAASKSFAIGGKKMKMTRAKLNLLIALPFAAVALAGCESGLTRYPGPQAAIAVATDRGFDSGPLENGVGAVVYDPDGCQGWLIDDGIEGYSGRRFDPVSGLPICNNQYPPGTVIGNYTTKSEGIKDYVPGVFVPAGPGVQSNIYGRAGSGQSYGQQTFGQ